MIFIIVINKLKNNKMDINNINVASLLGQNSDTLKFITELQTNDKLIKLVNGLENAQEILNSNDVYTKSIYNQNLCILIVLFICFIIMMFIIAMIEHKNGNTKYDLKYIREILSNTTNKIYDIEIKLNNIETEINKKNNNSKESEKELDKESNELLSEKSLKLRDLISNSTPIGNSNLNFKTNINTKNRLYNDTSSEISSSTDISTINLPSISSDYTSYVSSTKVQENKFSMTQLTFEREFYTALRKLKDNVINKNMTDYKIKVNIIQTITAESVYDLYDKIPNYNSHYNYYLIEKICKSKYEETKDDSYVKSMKAIVNLTLKHFTDNNIISTEIEEENEDDESIK